MKKRILTVSTVGIGVLAGLFLGNKENRAILKNIGEDLMNKFRKSTSSTEQHSVLENAGMPDQVGSRDHKQFENAKMVSEGSQYGVNYFNEIQENESN